MTSAHNLCETNFDFVKYAWNIATFCVLCLCRTFHLWPRPETSDPVSDTLNSGERASCRHDGDRHHIYCPVYPGTHYYHNLSQLQWKYTNIRNKCDIYPDFIDEDPDLLLLQSADLLQPLLLELIWLEDLDVGHRGPEDAALVVLDVLGQLVIPANGKCWLGLKTRHHCSNIDAWLSETRPT